MFKRKVLLAYITDPAMETLCAELLVPESLPILS